MRCTREAAKEKKGMERKTFFADVIVPVPVPLLYTYRLPRELEMQVVPGCRVIVPFGKSKRYAAIVQRIHETPPANYTAKYLEALLDEKPIIHPLPLKFWEWVSSYYLCTPGEMMNAALPSGLKLSSETRWVAEPVEIAPQGLSQNEQVIFELLLEQEDLGLDDLERNSGLKSPYLALRSLREKGLVRTVEEVQDKFRPKMETRVRFCPTYLDEKTLGILLDQLEKKAPKQVDLLMEMIRLSGTPASGAVKKASLNDPAALSALVKKGVLETYEVESGRLPTLAPTSSEKKLSPLQEQALDEVQNSMERNPVTLLHGVTSSGKTEIYTRLIRETLNRGEQVLYLIPEIAITTQLVHRLREYFGDAVGVYHSRFNENERVEVWHAVLSGDQRSEAEGQPYPKFSLIVGARSALFLPWKKLGLVIIDEEHDLSFKQQDPAPRYHARDAAIYLASMFKAPVILGSATPSMESFRNATEGKYGHVRLKERHGGTLLPEICVTDIRKEWRSKTMKGYFSPQLLEGIRMALNHKEQVILFQNRRGFAPVMECQWCGWRPECDHCDVSKVYHKSSQQLRCHYCGSSSAIPPSCPACGDANLKLKGLGTEQVEEELAIHFPSIRIGRMDLDSTRSRQAHFQLIQDFTEGRIQVLVGTQMVTKGLDFGNVSLVGILDADGLLGFPEFRAHERAFQLMEQVSGRAGRRMQRGNVILQSRNPDHPVIQWVKKHDYDGFMKEEMFQRRSMHFPPYFRIIELHLSHKEPSTLDGAAALLAENLRKRLGVMVHGPELPVVERVRDQYRKKITIRIPEKDSPALVKKEIRIALKNFATDPELRKIRIAPDVDPA